MSGGDDYAYTSIFTDFIVFSISAACKGDFSGLEAIGKGIGFLIILFVMLWLFTQPALLIVVIIIGAIAIIAFSSK